MAILRVRTSNLHALHIPQYGSIFLYVLTLLGEGSSRAARTMALRGKSMDEIVGEQISMLPWSRLGHGSQTPWVYATSVPDFAREKCKCVMGEIVRQIKHEETCP